MTRVVAGLILIALLAGCVGHTHIGGLSRDERAAIVRADSSCDDVGRRVSSDPASHCFVSRKTAD